MASTHKSLRSSTANKRPTTAIADGQIALNTNATSPGLFFKDSTGATIIKIGPVHVGTTAPNATPGSGGSTGNSTGEVWLDTSLTPVGVKIWDGSAWQNTTPSGSTTVQGLLELATNAETQTGSDTARAVTPAGLQSKLSDSTSTTSATTIASSTAVKAAYDLAAAAVPLTGGVVTGNLEIGTAGSLSFEGATANGFETTIAVVDPTADRTITLPDTTGTVVTTGDTGTVTGTMIASGTVTSSNIVDATIVDGDISATAEIAVSKLADGAARQLLQTDAAGTGVEWTSNVDIPGTLDVTGAAVFDSNLTVDTNTLHVDATNNRVGIGTTSPSYALDVNGNGSFTGSMRATSTGTFTVLPAGVSGNWTGSGFALQSEGNTAPIGFLQGSAERARIDSSGRLLVGNSTARVGEPQGGSAVGYTLSSTFEGTSTVPGSVSAIQNSASAAYDGPYFYFARTRGTLVGSSTIVASNDNLGTIAFAGADGTDIRTKAAEIYAQVDGTPGANDMPGRLVFSTTADGASTPTERLRIDSAGDITIAGGGLIKADFSNATLSSRTYFQTTAGNSPTVVGAIPNGTNVTSAFYSFNDSDPGNSAYSGVFVDSTKATLTSAVTGTGTYLPLVFQTNNQEQARFTTTDRYFRMASGTGGIQFNGDTAATNALNDYEEGTFTPTIVGATTAGTGTYITQTGRYTKIGNCVRIEIYMHWSAHTGTGAMRISGLPFTSLNVTTSSPPMTMYVANIAMTASNYPQSYVNPNSTQVIITQAPVGGGAATTVPVDTAGVIIIAGVYETAS
jgi:hypothetical protein